MGARAAADRLPDRLVEHLTGWVGGWPPRDPALVAGNPRNARPGWDGVVHPVAGVVAADGSAALGVPPDAAPALRSMAAGSLDDLLAAVPGALALPDHRVYRGVFRWTTTPAPLPDAGVWVDARSAEVPPWLRPFGHEVLMAFNPAGHYVAGVGVKYHDEAGHELAVVTEPEAQGKGLGRRLVAQAARRVLDEGAVPTYLHGPDNVASARVADAAGFPDQGWSVLGLFEQEE